MGEGGGLIRQLHHGDTAACEAVIRAPSLPRGDGLADDVAQTWLKAYAVIMGFEGRCRLRTWTNRPPNSPTRKVRRLCGYSRRACPAAIEQNVFDHPAR